MQIQKFKQFSFKKLNNRFKILFKKQLFKAKWKSKAIQKKAIHTWQQIKSKNNYQYNFTIFLEKIKTKNFLPQIDYKITKNSNNINILGQTINLENIDWHQKFNNQSFFQDINILINHGQDIKVPWELSRMQHIHSFDQINDWIDNNPYLLGVNWVCPMDVAIRAINLIYTLYSLKDSSNISIEFWQKLICSLYDHAIYLKNNWELFDKPNNHYLADLIGYFYLCFLFDEFQYFEKEKQKTYKKILDQFDKQILNDGTNYEGSTSYHKLVTEMFLHFYELCKKNNIILSNYFAEKLNKSIQFINDTKNIQIGDNDSGKILNNIKWLDIITKKDIIHHYSNFGLTIIKDSNWHITYRHPTYNKNQPTGHFHQDELSITLNYNNIPILVDPGTYVYTLDSKWRNLMRSKKMHNTFYIKEDNLDNIDLFVLPKVKQLDTSNIKDTKDYISIENFKYEDKKVKLYRKLILDKKNNQLIINDILKPIISKYYNTKLINPFYCHPRPDRGSSPIKNKADWNFIFHPQISLKQLDKHCWQINHKNKKILIFESDLEFIEESGYYSPAYGKIENCTKLYAKENIKSQIKTFLYPTKT